jgi:hypothetical protein
LPLAGNSCLYREIAASVGKYMPLSGNRCLCKTIVDSKWSMLGKHFVCLGIFCTTTVAVYHAAQSSTKHTIAQLWCHTLSSWRLYCSQSLPSSPARRVPPCTVVVPLYVSEHQRDHCSVYIHGAAVYVTVRVIWVSLSYLLLISYLSLDILSYSWHSIPEISV